MKRYLKEINFRGDKFHVDLFLRGARWDMSLSPLKTGLMNY